MRAWLALPMLALVALPALAANPDCPNAHDARLLPPPEAVLATLQGSGLALQLAPPAPQTDVVPADPLHSCTGTIRPGAQIVIEGAYLCTANWVFLDEANTYYIGTAGHCIPNLGWSRISIAGVSGDIGDPVFTTGDAGVGNDFALIRIDPALRGFIDPTLCRWGGPQALGTPGNTLPADAVLQYGWGFGYGSTAATRPREGTLNAYSWDDHALLLELNVAGGDSGSGVETRDGKALGIVTHTIEAPGSPAPIGLGLTYATRLDHAIDLANAGTGHSFRLLRSTHGVDLTGLSVP